MRSWGGLLLNFILFPLLLLLLPILLQLVHPDVGDGDIDPESMSLLLCWIAARGLLRKAKAIFRVAPKNSI